jgi:hypothetical protein
MGALVQRIWLFFSPCLEDGVVLQFPVVEHVFQNEFTKFAENFVWFLHRRESTNGKNLSEEWSAHNPVLPKCHSDWDVAGLLDTSPLHRIEGLRLIGAARSKMK